MRHARLLDVVALTEDVPEFGLLRGHVGTVIECFGHDAAEVEFCDNDGRPYALTTFPLSRLLVLSYHRIR